MCQCNNVDIGSYDNQITLIHNKKQICIDKCIAEEIKYLWNLGIETTGCCCGHNKLDGFIGVVFKDIPKMKELGYIVRPNELRPNDEDSFYLKSL